MSYGFPECATAYQVDLLQEHSDRTRNRGFEKTCIIYVSQAPFYTNLSTKILQEINLLVLLVTCKEKSCDKKRYGILRLNKVGTVI